MGKERTTVVQDSKQQQQTQVQQTPEERRLNQLALQQQEAIQPQQIELQKQGFNLINQALTGFLGGDLQRLQRGIDPEVTSGIVQQSLADIRPGLQASGIYDSGIRAELEARTAADIRRASEEANLNNLFNLLNLSIGGQAQVQQPTLASSTALGSRLAGLRSVSQTGSTSGTGTTYGMNPFLKSFQTSLGQTLGTPQFDIKGVGFGG